MKLVRHAWWPLVLVTSVAAWWAMAYWLEPRPLWVIPEGDALQLLQYDSTREVLLGARQLNDARRQFVILNAHSGVQLHELTVPDGEYLAGGQNVIDQSPRLVGKSVWWLAQTNNSNNSVSIELKEWKYPKEQQVRSHVHWNAGLDTESDANSIRHLPLRFAWSPHTSKVLLAYEVLPTNRIAKELMRVFNPFHVNENQQWLLDYRFSIVLCNVWQWQEATGQFQKVNTYPFRVSGIVNNRFRTHWSNDDSHYTRWPEEATTTHLTQTNVLTGKQTVVASLERPEVQTYHERSRAGSLLMLHRFYPDIRKVNGQTEHHMQSGPQRGGNTTWTLNEWRPLIDTVSWKQVPWPTELNPAIVGTNSLQSDIADPGSILFAVTVDRSNPFRQRSVPSSFQHEFIFLHYIDGILKLDRQLSVKSFLDCNQSILCNNQLFVQGTQGFEVSQETLHLLSRIRWIYQWYWEKWVKLNATYVAQLSVDDGRVLWKKKERVVDKHLPLLGTVRLLLRFQKMNSTTASGYECYALPMQFYSAWWPAGMAACILFVVVTMSVTKTRRKIIISS